MRTVAVLLGSLLVATGAAASIVLDVTILPKPGFPAPAKDVAPAGPRLVLVSSRHRDPASLPPARPGPPSWASRSFRGEQLQDAIRQGERLFLVYGPDGASGRYVVRANAGTRALLYAYDFVNITRPPNGGWLEPVTWAQEAGRVLFVETTHLTFARATKGRNAYISAIDLRTEKTLWRSPALVANARTFVIAGDLIVAGYGFTAEPDFLYLLDRHTGKVLDRLEVPTAPEIIKLRGGRLHVRTYDHDVVARIVG